MSRYTVSDKLNLLINQAPYLDDDTMAEKIATKLTMAECQAITKQTQKCLDNEFIEGMKRLMALGQRKAWQRIYEITQTQRTTQS